MSLEERMKKLILLSFFLMIVSMCAVAQTDSDASSSSTGNMKPVQGCLSSSQGKYVLTDSSGNAYMLSGQTAGLDSSVGHQVQVMGNEMHVESHSKTGTADNPAMSNETASMHMFKVQSFKDSGSSCSSGGTSQR
jgi:hypothetical protein